MGFLTNLRSGLAAMTTAEKIHMALDIICGAGGGIISKTVANQITPGMSRPKKALVNFTMCGLGMVAGDVASHAFYQYADAIGTVIDKNKEKNLKEAPANGK